MAKKTQGNSEKKTSYGMAELYGQLFNTLPNEKRIELIESKEKQECRFLASIPKLAPVKKGKPSLHCSKKGGVCSIRNFISEKKGEQKFGPITSTCPIRFYEDGEIFKTIGGVLLGNKDAEIVKEIPFLMRQGSPSDKSKEESEGDSGNEDVGRIDMVMVAQNGDRLDWCAVELQAVYFSGGAMSKDVPGIKAHKGDGVPPPGANRRPDFRSSGPKRLMPQLQIKVPTLRRWGKKMVVVVDRPFFDALGEMDHVNHVSNCDIVWIIVRFEETSGAAQSKLIVDEVLFTTLERAVEGLTAGTPTTLPDFEDKIRSKLGA